MKSKLFTLILFSACILFSKSIFAQLSGTYTIGGTTPDYNTIQDAATAVQASGVNGPVIFNIRPGTYTEKVDLGNVSGASSVNTITFKSENNDSTSVIVRDSASASNPNYLFHIFGTDYLIIRNITLERPGQDWNACVISLGSNPKYLQIRNCIIKALLKNTTNDASSLIHFPFGSLNDSSISISNNILDGGAYGIYFKGQSPASQIPLTQITNNQFINQGYRAMHLYNTNTINVNGNSITTNTLVNVYRAIFLGRGTGAFSISNNKITEINRGIPLHFDTCSGSTGSYGLVLNNFIHTGGTGTIRAIFVSQCSYINFFYNTINITTTGTNTAIFYINDAGSSNNLVVKNNIFVNTGGGIIYRIPSGALASLTSSDHNDLYIPPSSPFIALLDTINIPSITDWQMASLRDSNSVSGDPHFVSATDLHSISVAVNDLGVVVPGVVTDIDGDSRSNSTPDIGADEFTPFSDNLGVFGFVSPVSSECGDSIVYIGVIIHNLGLGTQTGFPLHAEITGDITQTLSEVYSDSLVSNEEDTLYFSQTLNLYAGGSIDIVTYIALTLDQFRTNDTIHGTFILMGQPNNPTVQSPQQFCENNIQVTATADSGDVLYWYDEAVGGNLLFAGNPFPLLLTSDTTLYVESHIGSSSIGCLRFTEIEADSTPNFFEIQNISAVPIDATGCRLYVSANGTNINAVFGNYLELGNFNPGEIQYKSDNVNDSNYWGSNIPWVGGLGGWALMIDSQGNIIDFVIWDWDSTEIQSMNITVNGFNISPGTAWSGNGLISCLSLDNQRIGNEDHDNASDWICQHESLGTTNVGLDPLLKNCGVGYCGSERLPVDITLISGITPVNLGNDTSFAGPFSLTLDADTGYTSYLWSTGETTQSILVNVFDTYWVTVTGGSNGCSYTDSITINSTVGISNIISLDEFSFFPNPASDKLILRGQMNIFEDAIIRITDLQGREAKGLIKTKTSKGESLIDISSLTNGIYFLQVVSGNRMRVEKFIVLR